VSGPWHMPLGHPDELYDGEDRTRELEDESLEAALNDHDPVTDGRPCKPGCVEVWDHVGLCVGTLGLGWNVYRCAECGREDWI